MRSHGKRGVRPRENVGQPIFENYITRAQALPDAPITVDRMSEVTSWPMYLNDQLSNCTCAGMGHLVAAMTAFSGDVPGGAMFSNDVIEKMYSIVGDYIPGQPSTDRGATLQTCANFMKSVGLTDLSGRTHKWAGWAQIGDPTNLPLLKKVLNIFGSVYMAFELPDNAETQFDNEQPFTYIPGYPADPNDGHCMVMQYSAVGDPGVINDEELITWGSEQKVNEAWMRHCAVQAIVGVSNDFITANGNTIDGYNLQQLLQDSQIASS